MSPSKLSTTPNTCLANDDTHGAPEDNRDTYESWTMARVKERTTEAILEALATGASYGSTGPRIHDIQLRRVDRPGDESQLVEATVRCSEAQRIAAVHDQVGVEYREPGKTFESATFTLRANARWARFEVVGPDGAKAWSNPFDLTVIERDA